MKNAENLPFELIDTHCHLYLEEFAGDVPAMMGRAAEAGVTRFYLPGLDRAHFQAVLDLEQKYPGQCFAMVGVHPCYVNENWKAELSFVSSALEARRFAAVGEIGLDFYWSREFDECQIIIFREQLNLALQHGLPVVIHSRNSMDETIDVLRGYQGLTGIFHCFSGNVDNAKNIIDCGLKLGIGGVLTYKNAGLDKVVAEIALEDIVLETDAPYLSPVPYRGKRNESSYLTFIASKLAEIKNMDIGEVAAITTANARKVFG